MPGSSNPKAQQNSNFCVKEMKEKSVTFCFLKLKTKEEANIPKIIKGRGNFCGEFRSLLSKLMFTHSASS